MTQINYSIATQNMSFKTKEFKHFLLSVHKQKIESIHIQSDKMSLMLNAAIQRSESVSSASEKPSVLPKEKLKIKPRINTSSQVLGAGQEEGLYFTIVSPMIGTFYRSPAPSEAAFINISDSVKVNQTVCIIEAMKLMNEIESEVNGNIVEILVEDGDIVDCGQALMRVKEK